MIDLACYPRPLPTHLVEEVDGGEDGEYGYGQGHILGAGVRGQDPSLPFPLPTPTPGLPPPAGPLLTS